MQGNGDLPLHAGSVQNGCGCLPGKIMLVARHTGRITGQCDARSVLHGKLYGIIYRNALEYACQRVIAVLTPPGHIE